MVRFFSALRRLVLTTFATSLLLLGASTPAFTGAPKAAPPGHPGAVKADLDGNKLFDDLEAKLVGLPDDGKLSAIVTLTAGASSTRIEALTKRIGHFPVSHRLSLIDAFAATLSKGQINALARTPEVIHVEENSEVNTTNDGSKPSFGLTKAQMDSGLDGDGDGSPNVYSRNDLVAAVLDTGLDAAHRDLDGGKVIGFKDFVNGRTAPYDDHGHGTHVAATLAGDGEARADRLYRGVAPAAALVGVKVLNSYGSGSMADVAAALDWVVANKTTYGIEAINLSLATTGCANGTDATSTAVNRAHDYGLLVAVAAGNRGPGTCTIGAPAAASKAITVGAMADSATNTGEFGFRQTYFSGRGPTADGRIKPDISGPGLYITSAKFGTADAYTTMSGTSMATPFVAGVALLMREVNPGLTPQQVKD